MKKRLIFFSALVLLLIGFSFWGASIRGLLNFKKKLENKNVLNIGTSADFPPFSYIENGQIKGFDIDLVTELAMRLNKEVRILDLPFLTLIPELDAGVIDMIAGGLTETVERAQRVSFSVPYLKNIKLLVITLADNPISNINELTGKKVIVNDGYTADIYMSNLNNIDLERIPTVADAFIALEKGQAFAFVSADNTVAPFFAKYRHNKFSILPIEGTDDAYRFAVNKNNNKLLMAINAVLEELEKDGTLGKLKHKWNLQ